MFLMNHKTIADISWSSVTAEYKPYFAVFYVLSKVISRILSHHHTINLQPLKFHLRQTCKLITKQNNKIPLLKHSEIPHIFSYFSIYSLLRARTFTIPKHFPKHSDSLLIFGENRWKYLLKNALQNNWSHIQITH